jgi:hypothetical protein
LSAAIRKISTVAIRPGCCSNAGALRVCLRERIAPPAVAGTVEGARGRGGRRQVVEFGRSGAVEFGRG